MGLIAVQCCSLLIFTQKDTPALAAPFESAKQGVHFAAKITTPHWNFATKKREKAALLLDKIAGLRGKLPVTQAIRPGGCPLNLIDWPRAR
jgi:hypothetical protein